LTSIIRSLIDAAPVGRAAAMFPASRKVRAPRRNGGG
jgi:hypothetical protein